MMTHDLNCALANWLSNGDRAMELVLQHCQIESQDDGKGLKFNCPKPLFDTLLIHLDQIDWKISCSLIKAIELYTTRAGETRHELSLLTKNLPRAIAHHGVDTLGVQLLHQIGVDFDRPIAIVEMHTNRPIFCSTGILEQSKARDVEEWIGAEDMGKYHYPEGLKTLENAYNRGIDSTEWIAKTFDGQDVKIAANVYAATHNNRPVRVVENLDWQLI